MADIDLDRDAYRRAGRPKIIPRKDALLMIACLLAGCLFLQWLVGQGGKELWYYGFLVWPGLIYAGALVTRVWPLLLTKDD